MEGVLGCFVTACIVISGFASTLQNGVSESWIGWPELPLLDLEGVRAAGEAAEVVADTIEELFCRRAFGVPVVDARGWLSDEQFEDGHHPLLAGQQAFTNQLYRDVLLPLTAVQRDDR